MTCPFNSYNLILWFHISSIVRHFPDRQKIYKPLMSSLFVCLIIHYYLKFQPLSGTFQDAKRYINPLLFNISTILCYFGIYSFQNWCNSFYCSLFHSYNLILFISYFHHCPALDRSAIDCYWAKWPLFSVESWALSSDVINRISLKLGLVIIHGTHE